MPPIDTLPSELVGRIAESTFGTVGLEFVMSAGRIINAAWGTKAVFVSEADPTDPGSGRIMLAASDQLRRAELPEWIPAARAPWFPPAGHTKSSGTSLDADDDPLLERLQLKSYVMLQIESRSTSRSEYVGIVDSVVWDASRVAAAEALLRMIAGRVAAELERERLAAAAATRARALMHVGKTLHDGVLVFSGDTHLTVDYINDAAQELLGLTAADLGVDDDTLARLASLPRVGGDGEYEGEIAAPHRGGVDTGICARVLSVLPADGVRTYYCVLSTAGELERELLADDEWRISGRRIEGANTGLIVSNRGEVTLSNARAADLLGTTQREGLGAVRIVVRTDKGDVSMTLGECLRQLERHRNATRVIRVRPKRGGDRFIDLRSQVLTSAGATRLVAHLVDVTARERRIGELEERNNIYRSILASVPIGILGLDQEGRVVWMGDHWMAAAAGQPPEELRWASAVHLGDDFIDACEEGVRAAIPFARDISVGVASVLKKSVPRYMTEFSLTNAGHDEPSRWFLSFATPVAEGGGAVFGLVETTAIMRRVRDAQIDSARAWTLLANLPEQVARLAPNGDLVQVIGPAQRAPGVALLPSGAFKRNVREVLPPEEAAQLLDAAREAMQRNQTVITTLRIINHDAERLYDVRLLPQDQEVLLTLLDRTAEQHAKTQREPDSVSPRLRRRNPYDLTFREASVLELMADGASDKEIAQRLGVSVFTVNKHVSKVLHKMGAASRTEASMRAMREALVTR
jgi:DNA-binding NarL/FixJ family response regulator/PAS domain-containing protein